MKMLMYSKLLDCDRCYRDPMCKLSFHFFSTSLGNCFGEFYLVGTVVNKLIGHLVLTIALPWTGEKSDMGAQQENMLEARD